MSDFIGITQVTWKDDPPKIGSSEMLDKALDNSILDEIVEQEDVWEDWDGTMLLQCKRNQGDRKGHFMMGWRGFLVYDMFCGRPSLWQKIKMSWKYIKKF